MRNLHHGDCRTSYAMPGDDDGRCCRRGLPRTGLLYSSVRPIASGLEIPTSRGGPLPHLGTWYSYAWATTDPRSAHAADRDSSECPARAKPAARARPPFHDLLLIPNAKAKASASSRPWLRPAWSKSKTCSGTKSAIAPPSASFGRTEMVGQGQNQLRMMIPGPLCFCCRAVGGCACTFGERGVERVNARVLSCEVEWLAPSRLFAAALSTSPVRSLRLAQLCGVMLRGLFNLVQHEDESFSMASVHC
jgi:hypothetical protein